MIGPYRGNVVGFEKGNVPLVYIKDRWLVSEHMEASKVTFVSL